jgi:hypothetical protein
MFCVECRMGLWIAGRRTRVRDHRHSTERGTGVLVPHNADFGFDVLKIALGRQKEVSTHV